MLGRRREERGVDDRNIWDEGCGGSVECDARPNRYCCNIFSSAYRNFPLARKISRNH